MGSHSQTYYGRRVSIATAGSLIELREKLLQDHLNSQKYHH